MKMKCAVAALFCAVCASANADYTYQALFWQVNENASLYENAAFAGLYAVVGGNEIEGEGREVSVVVSKSQTAVLVGDGSVWDWGSYDISQASFYVELLNSDLDKIGVKSDVVAYNLLGPYMDRNDSGSASPGLVQSPYVFAFAVPEPTGAALVLLGLAGLALRRRKRLA